MKRSRSLAIVGIPALVLFVNSVNAVQPTRIPFEVDVTFPSERLTALCGIPVSIHLQGSGTTTLFYNQSGTRVIRELDTLAGGATITIFSPIDAGGTGKSFTDVTHSPATFLYPEGTEIGDPAIVILNGVQLTSGPGSSRIVGHEVEEGIIVGFTPEGIPVVDTVATISQSGQFDLDAVLQARCTKLSSP